MEMYCSGLMRAIGKVLPMKRVQTSLNFNELKIAENCPLFVNKQVPSALESFTLTCFFSKI